ncbi:MAG TPA: cytochrome c oxidase assembly protein [Acidimicrobiia bacterium]|nr:cytochrome c oxidase assembly protein [Acidimicrobiia bacterium]
MPYAWHAHPDVWLVVAVLFGGYFWALRHLGPRHTAPGQPVATRLQKICWVSGVATVLVASDWPVHDLSEKYLYSVHMTQHLLMTLVAPPLLLLGTPAWLARELLRPPALYRAVRTLARPFPALVLFNILIVVTHWPAFVDATLGSELVHFLTHAALFLSALAMWAPVTAPLPELRPLAAPAQMLYLFLQSVVPTVPASFLVFAEKPIYRFYVDVPRLWGLSAGEDQRIAGLLMKIGGGLLLWMVIAVLFFKWHSAEEQNDREARHWRDLERELETGPDAMRWTR